MSEKSSKESQQTHDKPVEAWLTDMDGVLVHEEEALPGAKEFLSALADNDVPYLVLTNNSIFTTRDLAARLHRCGLEVPEERIWTSALATAEFLKIQSPETSVMAVGEAGLTTALYTAGFTMTTSDPEYVVLGETRSYDFQTITQAIRLINRGAKFIATNPDATGPSSHGVLPATGAVAAMVTKATGKQPYFVGKPSPIMIRGGLNKLGAHSETTALVGDRMDTDIQAGIETGLRSYLVLSGSTKESEIERFPFRPGGVYESIADLVEVVEEHAKA